MKRRTFVSTGLLSALVATGCASDKKHAQADPTTPRLATPRALAPRGLALALGSGGPRGFAHVGALLALDKLAIKPDLIVGSSVGAVIGSLLAAGRPAADIQRLALSLSAWDVIDINLSGLFTGQLFTGRSVARLVMNESQAQLIEELATPFASVATRVTDSTPQCFNVGELPLAVKASVAVVGIAPPVDVAGTAYCDGDLACPVPARVARSLGAKRVIAVDVSAWDEDTPARIRDPANGMSYWLKDAERRNALTALERPASDAYLHLRTPYYAHFSRDYRLKLIELGFAQTMARADELRKLAA
jgi:NTE family protein